MYGKKIYEENNFLFNRLLGKYPFLIASHRGFAHADIIENTVLSMKLAAKFGADIIETDTSVTLDNKLVMLHPDREKSLFQRDIHVEEWYLFQLKALPLFNNIGAVTKQQINSLDEFITGIPTGKLIHFDRNESHLELLLKSLDKYPEKLPQFMIKIIPNRQNFALLKEWPNKYMLIPVISDRKELYFVLEHLSDNLNVVGIETTIVNRNKNWLEKNFFDHLLEKNLAPLGNALDLSATEQLFGGYDDYHSLFDNHSNGWKKFYELGIKQINTDWPQSLFRYRQKWLIK